jgi:LysM repeat protein
MDQHSDFEIEEMREVAENIGRSRKRKGDSSPPYIIIAGVVIICLIIVFALFSGDGKKETSEDIKAINDRLEQLDGKLSQLDELDKKISNIEKKVASSVKSLSQLKRTDTSLKKDISKTNKQISLLKDELSSVSGKTQTSGTVKKKRDYHVVQRGDSLLGVAKKYRMEISELLDLNKLTLKSTIHPGQKIIIRSN